MRLGRAVQGRDQRPVAADLNQRQRLVSRLEQSDHVFFERRVARAVNVLAQAFHDRLFQLFQALSILRSVVGQREREIHATASKLRIHHDIRRHGHVVLEPLIDLRLAQAHEAQRQRAAGQAGAEAPAQERDQFVAHHRL